jgi:hypothetical protein
VPDDFEVHVLDEDEKPEARTVCLTCHRAWDDSVSTGRTPTPGGRCPFEEFHLDADEEERLKSLEDLENTLGDLHVAANHGVTLIADGSFKDHAMDVAESMGALGKGWPFDCIDWERAADQLKVDYSIVEFEGETYYTRDL